MNNAVTDVARKTYGARVPTGNIAGAGRKGTEAHRLLMKIARGEELDRGNVLTYAGYRERRLADVMRRTDASVVGVEIPVEYKDENGKPVYHGRADMVVYMSDKASGKSGLMVADLKTENRQDKDMALLQTSAYLHAWNQMHPDKPARYVCVIWIPDKKHATLDFEEPMALSDVLEKYSRGERL